MYNNTILTRLEDAYLEPAEDTRKVYCYCSSCEEPIYEDDTYYEVLGENICEVCMMEGQRCAESA